jgi:2'-5' RNA ligase
MIHMRLFVAVDLPDAVRQAAASAADRLRDRLGRVAARSRITWVSTHVLHLTLVFLGEVDEAAGSEAVERLRAPLPLAPFALGIGGAGLFPPSGRPRVLWLAVATGAAALDAARTAVEARLDGVPYRREHRAFAPHLTIARFKDGGTAEERRAVERTSTETSAPAVVRDVTLYRSRLSPRGPEYVALAHCALAGGATS